MTYFVEVKALLSRLSFRRPVFNFCTYILCVSLKFVHSDIHNLLCYLVFRALTALPTLATLVRDNIRIVLCMQFRQYIFFNSRLFS